MKTNNSRLMEKIINCVESNFETLTCSTLTLSDIFGILSIYFPLVVATTVFICFLMCVHISESKSDVIVNIVIVLFTFITLIEANKERRRRLKDVEIIHNLRKIKKEYSNEKMFKTFCPIIRAMLSLKQEYPETDLRRLYKLNESLFTEKRLLGLNLHNFEP
jgi:hypothetical protein